MLEGAKCDGGKKCSKGVGFAILKKEVKVASLKR